MKRWISRGTAALLGLPFTIAAQTPAQPPTDEQISEVIVVTAQKRTTTLQDVPFSVAAMTSEDIKESGATNIVEIARNVPGLYITDLGPGQSQVAIRGISAGQVVRDQPGVKESVGIYLDESPISVALFTPDLDLYDLDRIEVLRGPQGTLFGAGSSSGTVRYITAQPNVGRFGGSAEAGFNTLSGGDWGGSLKGAVNVPLGDDAAMRAVGYYDELAGFIDSIYPGRPTRHDVNGGSKAGGRLAFRIEPTEHIAISPRVVYQKLETDGYPRVDVYSILGNPYTTTEPPVTPGRRQQVTQIGEGLTDEFSMADLTLEFGFGDVGLTSVTTYIDRTVNVVRDASQLTGSVTKSLGGTDAEARLDSPLIDHTDLQVFSQELRLASSGEGPFQWLAGAFYQSADRKYGQTLPTPGYDAVTLRLVNHDSAFYGAPPDTPYYSRLSYDFRQFAVFGEATYRFNPQWALTGGLRYYDFNEDRLLTFAGVFADMGYRDQPGSTSSDGLSPRVILAFSPNKNVQLTAQAAKGFRLGGINDPLNVTLCQGGDLATYSGHPTWDDEKVMNYEVGAKTRLADGRVTLNGSVFMTTVDGLQVIADAGSCSSRIVLNADAQTRGAEMELFAHPDEHWDFGLSATFVDAQITETQRDSNGNVIAGIRDGNWLPTSPDWQFAATGAFTWGLGDALESYVRLTAQHVGRSYTQLADQEPGFGFISNAPNAPAGSAALIDMGTVDGNPNTPAIEPLTVPFDPRLEKYDIVNLRWGIRADRWEGTLYVNNLFDERAFLSVDRERGRRARVGYLTNPPRSYGVSFRLNF
ncbi:MAG TPA: TonB-dependent receptor [Steroidobacteraceae bacterium]|jgi:iron complex outermembrane receptor protein|nr:TonB-dependent receptor [Steroidobacteraceae bacterium]